jgi:protocatechuate 3,4-dioxygenase beta subunit
MRSAHIQVDVSGRWDRVITQMYFPNEPILTQDQILRHDLWGETDPMPARIFGTLTPAASTLEPGATLCRFDVVLSDG